MAMARFELKSGNQPEAIKVLTNSIAAHNFYQTLVGVMGMLLA